MNKEQLQEQINQFKDQINIFQKQLDELQEEQIDFSKWIGRDDDILAIKGDKYLISYPNGSITHSNVNKDNFTDKITYRIGTFKDLKQGDVFILKEEANELSYIDISDFYLFIGKDRYGYVAQYLTRYSGLQKITCKGYYHDDDNNDKDIIIFNRN